MIPNFKSTVVSLTIIFVTCNALSSTSQPPTIHSTTKRTLFTVMQRGKLLPKRQVDAYASSNTSNMSSPSNNNDQTSSMKQKQKQFYLLSDEGFPQKIIINLLSISLIIAATFTSPRLQTPVVYLYNFVIDRMQVIAHRNAWWFLLATLSSSCCVLQLLLNTLSVGCAGFNTVSKL